MYKQFVIFLNFCYNINIGSSMKKYYIMASIILLAVFMLIFYKMNVSYNSLPKLTNIEHGYSVATSVNLAKQEEFIQRIYSDEVSELLIDTTVYKFGFDELTNSSIIYTTSVKSASENLDFLENGDFNCYSTFNKDCGNIYDIGQDFEYSIYDLNTAYEKNNLDGIYYFVPNDLSHELTEAKKMEYETAAKYFSDIATIDLNQEAHELDHVNYMSLIFTLVLFATIISLNFMRKNKHILIVEIFNGFSFFEMIKSNYVKIVIPLIFLFLSTFIVAFIFMFRGISSYNIFIFIELAKYLGYIVIYMIILNLVLLAVIYYSNLDQMLKGRVNQVHTSLINSLIKYAVLLILLAQFLVFTAYLPLYTNIQKSESTFSKGYNEYLNIGSTSPYVGSQLSEEYTTNLQNTYLDLQDSGAILSNIFNDRRFENVEYSGWVNPNYLEEFNILDVDGEKITVSNDTMQQITLIPESMYTSDIQDKYKNTEFILYPDGQEFLNIGALNQEGNAEFKIVNPVIQVYNGHNAMVTDFYAMLIDMSREELVQVFADNNLSGGFSNIYSVGELMDLQVSEVYTKMMYEFTITLILIFMFIGVLLQENIDYFERKKESISIKLMSGYTFIQLMIKPIMYRFLCYTSVITFYMLRNYNAEPSAMVLVYIIFILDIVSVFVVIRTSYQVNLLKIIKGD